MSAVREVMTTDVTVADEEDSLVEVARKLAADDVGALPICGTDKRLKGVVTDRDIVTKVLAQERDPSQFRARDLEDGDGETVTIGADDSVEEALQTMADHKVRRLPVIDGERLVGMVSQSDLARVSGAGATDEEISSAPPNN
jgi:CBS-domain-containing membrane protein